jgi:hypothetical protein
METQCDVKHAESENGTVGSKNDLEKGRDLVRARRARGQSFIGSHGVLDENVAACVAEGIALGRSEGIALARERIVQALEELA